MMRVSEARRAFLLLEACKAFPIPSLVLWFLCFQAFRKTARRAGPQVKCWFSHQQADPLLLWALVFAPVKERASTKQTHTPLQTKSKSYS